MTKNQRGFSLVELMITMLIFVVAIAAASNILTGLLGQFKQQSSVAESNIGGVVGLEMLRGDLETAGSGLPWVMGDASMGFAAYTEAVNDGRTPWDDTLYNDVSPNAPRAVVIGQPANGFQTEAANTPSDVLVIKAANISLNQTVRRWTYIANTGGLPNALRTWGDAGENLADTARVIVINPERGPNAGILMSDGGVFFKRLEELPAKGGAANPVFEPTTSSYATFLVYGISESADPRMPFNRADFYIKPLRDAGGNLLPGVDADGDGWPDALPRRCEPSTGVLYKAVINNTTDPASGGRHTELPLLDCVGYMKAEVVFDPSNNGNLIAEAPVSAGRDNAASLRQLKQIRVYIIAQEGQRDPSYQSPPTIAVPDVGATVFNVPDRSYRWKLYTLVITPTSLR